MLVGFGIDAGDSHCNHLGAFHLLHKTHFLFSIRTFCRNTAPQRADVEAIGQTHEAHAHRVFGTILSKPAEGNRVVALLVVAQVLIIEVAIGVRLLDFLVLDVGVARSKRRSPNHKCQ